MPKTHRRRLLRAGLLAALALSVAAVATAAPAPAAKKGPKPGKKETTATALTPATEDIPPGGIAHNFDLVAHLPLLDDHQWAGNTPLGIPRGSNGDLTAAGHCVYIGSIIGYQPALIVNVRDPRRPFVVGPVPDLVPGVGNGMEGIEASGDLLVIDQRNPVGGLSFTPPAGLPRRGLAIYDISDCERPRLVARYDYQGKNTHLISLWRDPTDPRRVVGLQSFSDEPQVQAIDLTGCPRSCNPRNVANWSARTQYGLDKFGRQREHTHEAVLSVDGNRVYMSQYRDGTFLLDSSRLIRTLRGQDTCDPSAPTFPNAAGHCLAPLNVDYDAREDTSGAKNDEWHHTPIKVPGRPYLIQVSESSGPRYVPDDPLGPIRSNCPGALLRLIYIGEDEYQHPAGTPMRGDLYPVTTGIYGTEEQKYENCGPDGFKPGTAPKASSWFSPHGALVFPNIAIVTYYGGGLRAVDISNPFILREAGYFFNKPVETIRWASYGIVTPLSDLTGPEYRRPDGLFIRRPTVGPPHIFTFSYVVSYNGHVIYGDIHSGIYILRYKGPHADEIPERGLCVSGNPGAIEPGYEPCPPYGRDDRWDAEPVTSVPGGEEH